MTMTRYDLPFIRPREDGPGIASHWDVPHDPEGYWSNGLAIGRLFFAEVAKLAETNEIEAALSMKLAPNSGDGWNAHGWGIEEGFSEAMAAAAIVGLRAIRLGLVTPISSKGDES